MRQVRFARPGSPAEVVEIVEREEPGLSEPDDVLVAIDLFPINPADLLTLQGHYPIERETRFDTAGCRHHSLPKHFPVQDDIGAQRLELRRDVRASNQVHRPQTPLGRHLDHSASDRGVRGVLDDPVAGLKRDEAQQQRGRRGVHLESGGGEPIRV